MKVFISWSGELSKKVAEILKPWIKCVLQATEPFISTEDIDKGSLWFGEINDQLANTSIGIICLTRENIQSPWILFEAGSLAKGLTKTRVCTFLINLTPTDLKPPLSQFNATQPTQDDMLKLMKSINATMGEKALPEDILEMTFNQFWGSFKAKFEAAIKNYKPPKQVHQRPLEDMIEEVLEICRSIQKSTQQSSAIPLSSAELKLGSAKFPALYELLEHLAEQKSKSYPTVTPEMMKQMEKYLNERQVEKYLNEQREREKKDDPNLG